MTHSARLETWRHPTTGRATGRAVAGKANSGAGGDIGGDKVETEWRHQTLSMSCSPFGVPGPVPAGRHTEGCFDARKAGPLLAVPCLESDFCCANVLPARAARRLAALVSDVEARRCVAMVDKALTAHG